MLDPTLIIMQLNSVPNYTLSTCWMSMFFKHPGLLPRLYVKNLKVSKLSWDNSDEVLGHPNDSMPNFTC